MGRRRTSARRAGEHRPLDVEALGIRRVERGPGDDPADPSWVVSRTTGSAATKPYRCPGCQQPIAPATPHVVAWPMDGPVHDPSSAGVDERRHWHTACWAAHDRRPPGRTR